MTRLCKLCDDNENEIFNESDNEILSTTIMIFKIYQTIAHELKWMMKCSQFGNFQ